jgi:hypothetical protein
LLYLGGGGIFCGGGELSSSDPHIPKTLLQVLGRGSCLLNICKTNDCKKKQGILNNLGRKDDMSSSS